MKLDVWLQSCLCSAKNTTDLVTVLRLASVLLLVRSSPSLLPPLFPLFLLTFHLFPSHPPPSLCPSFSRPPSHPQRQSPAHPEAHTHSCSQLQRHATTFCQQYYRPRNHFCAQDTPVASISSPRLPTLECSPHVSVCQNVALSLVGARLDSFNPGLSTVSTGMCARCV